MATQGQKKTTRKPAAAKSNPVSSIDWPVDENGQPMAKISFSATEKIPTGQYANVNVGPVTATKFVKDDDNLAAELNKLAELVETECIAEQRELVLQSLQADSK